MEFSLFTTGCVSESFPEFAIQWVYAQFKSHTDGGIAQSVLAGMFFVLKAGTALTTITALLLCGGRHAPLESLLEVFPPSHCMHRPVLLQLDSGSAWRLMARNNCPSDGRNTGADHSWRKVEKKRQVCATNMKVRTLTEHQSFRAASFWCGISCAHSKASSYPGWKFVIGKSLKTGNPPPHPAQRQLHWQTSNFVFSIIQFNPCGKIKPRWVKWSVSPKS